MSISHTSGTLRQAAVIFTVFATIVALSGVVYLAPVAKEAYGQTIADGDLVKTADNPDVYIVKLIGAKSFKRLILNPTIFESYGHLSWGNIKTVSQATLNSYTNTNLVIEVNPDGSVADPKVYAVTSAAASDVGERRHLNVTAAQFEAAGLDWDSIYKINHTEALPSFYPTMTALTASDNLATWATQGPTGSVGSPASGLSVSLSASTPGDQTVAKGAVDVVFGKYNLSAGTSGSVKINEITVTQGGLSTTADYLAIKLYRNSVAVENRVGASLTLSSTTQKARFTGLNWTLNAGTTDTLIVVATVKNASTTVGAIMKLGINAASDIVLDGGEAVSGSFPLFPNSVTAANLAVGNLGVKMLTTPTASNLISGSTDQHIGSVQFVTDDENFRVQSIRITQTNTAIPADLSNITLKYLGEVLATIPSLGSTNTGTFALSSGADGNANMVKDGLTKTFDIYTDVAGGINVQRKVTIGIQQASDVSVRGESSGGLVTAELYQASDSLDGSAYVATVGAIHTITQGSLTVAISSGFNPSNDSVVVGSSARKATAFRFSAGSDEGVRVTEFTITVTLGGGALATSLGTITLAHVNDDGSVGATIAEGVISGTTLTFGTNDINSFDTQGLFDVEKSKNVDVYLLFSLPAGTYVDGNDTYGFGVAATAGHVKADGLSSLNDLPAITPTALTGPVYTESQKGTVAYSTSGTPSSTTIVPGATDVDFAHWQITASGENVLVSSMAIRASVSDNTVLTGSNDVANVRVYKESISAGNLLYTQSTVSAGIVNASFTDTIVAGTTRTYIIVADVLTSADEATIMFEALNSTTIGVVLSGVASGEAIDGPNADELDANSMTVSNGTLGVIASGLPILTDVTQLSSDVEVARFVFTAGSAEAVRLNTVRVRLAGYAEAAVNKSIAPSALTSIKLYDVSTGLQVGSTVGSLTLGKASFTGLNKTIAKDAQLILGVKVTIGSVSDARFIVFGIDDYYADLSATGVDSGATVYANQLVHTTSGALLVLTGATLAADVDLNADITDNLDDYGVPTLGITASATALDNAVIQIESEAIGVVDADNATTVHPRAGLFGTTAVGHAIGAPVQLKVAASHVVFQTDADEATYNADTSIVNDATVLGAFAAGNLMVLHSNVATGFGVAGDEDLIRLVTAISANGLTVTFTDAYQGTAVTEGALTNGEDFSFIHLTNYGQAQQVRTKGTLTFAVSSGTPAVGQVVAGATNVEFSRLKVTSLYEPVLVKKVVLTRSGGADTDFASVYLQNMTDPTWGPSGNGKSATAQLVGGKVTFTFSDADALVVSHIGTGTDFALKANINTTTAGATSSDAPKFYLANVSTTDLTGKGQATGQTVTSFTAGVPTPETSGNFNSQVVYKGVLDIALNSTSLSGTATRSPNQTILKLDFDSADAGSVATFRQGYINEMEATTTDFTGNTLLDGTWSGVAATVAADADTYVGSGAAGDLNSLKVSALDGTDGLLYTFGAANTDLSDYTGLGFWLRVDTDATADSSYVVTIDDGAATSTKTYVVATSFELDHWYFVDIPFADLTGTADLTLIDTFSITAVEPGADAADIIFVDKFYFYKDKVKVNMASNGGLGGAASTNTAKHTISGTLKNGSTTLATAFYSGNLSATAAAEATTGHMTFIPTASQFTIPTSGVTLSVVADTTALATAAKTLSLNIGLGSANNAGTVTAGDVYWWDEIFNTTANSIKWVGSVVAPVQGGTISY